MRLPLLLDTGIFSDAELSGIRLDGDGFLVGDATVPLDLPVGVAVRAASLGAAAEALSPAAVAVERTAAWIHGAEPLLRRPLHWAIDLSLGRLGRTRVQQATERVFHRTDLVRLGGVAVTTPLRTAFDLARGATFDAPTAAVCALLVGRASAAEVRVGTQAFPAVPYKALAIERLQRLVAARPDQPADTR